MEPTYPHGSVAWSVRFSGEVMPGDVVVVNTDKGRVVKRVAYIEGDVVTRYVRGLEHVDAVTDDRVADWVRAGWRGVPLRVPQSMVYLLGDNSLGSTDSRQLGFFRVADIERIVVDPRPFQGDRQEAYVSVPGGSGVL